MTHSVPNVATLDPQAPSMIRLADDPWSLGHGERLAMRTALAEVHVHWMQRLNGLIEPPYVDDAFPAFLLGTRPFAHLADAIGDATERTGLDTGTADELQRFVDHYRSYLIVTPTEPSED